MSHCSINLPGPEHLTQLTVHSLIPHTKRPHHPTSLFLSIVSFPQAIQERNLELRVSSTPLSALTLVLTFTANIRNSLKATFLEKLYQNTGGGAGYLMHPKGRLQLKPRKDQDCILRTQSSESPVSSFLSGFLVICTDSPKVFDTPTLT